MTNTLKHAATAALLLLAPAIYAPAAHAAEPTPAACPTQPLRITRSTGETTTYRGTVAGIPELCSLTRPDGSGAFYYGAWRSDWPGAGDAYPALHTVLLGPKGTSAAFDTHSIPGMQWHDTLVNQGRDTLMVAGKPHQVLILAHEREGFDGNTYHSIITSWRDVATGVTLKVVENQIAGQSYGPNTTWTAMQIEALPGS